MLCMMCALRFHLALPWSPGVAVSLGDRYSRTLLRSLFCSTSGLSVGLATWWVLSEASLSYLKLYYLIIPFAGADRDAIISERWARYVLSPSDLWVTRLSPLSVNLSFVLQLRGTFLAICILYIVGDVPNVYWRVWRDVIFLLHCWQDMICHKPVCWVSCPIASTSLRSWRRGGSSTTCRFTWANLAVA